MSAISSGCSGPERSGARVSAMKFRKGAALLLAEDFARDEEFLVILGDNVIHENIGKFVNQFKKERNNFDAKILVAKVKNPEKYGVVQFKGKKIVNITEKPSRPRSQYVNTGLWMFKPKVFELLKALKKSPRGEYEVTEVLDHYAKKELLSFSILKSKWTDAGSFESLYAATILMKKIESRQKKKIK